MGLIDLKRISEVKALNDWRHYCNLARRVAQAWPKLENLAIILACKHLRKTE